MRPAGGKPHAIPSAPGTAGRTLQNTANYDARAIRT
nr:MAG TPA_asm: hypothetical protein [Bacteriophage sp.]